MRSLQLLITVVASACILAQGLPEHNCKRNGGCRLPIDPQLDIQQQMDAIAKALNSNALAKSFMNMTATYEYSSGNTGTTIQTEEVTLEQISESRQLETVYTVILTKENAGGVEYETAVVMIAEAEISIEEGVISYLEEGLGTFYELGEGGNYTIAGNITLSGSGTMVELNTTAAKIVAEIIQVVKSPYSITMDSIFAEATEVASGNRVRTTGSEVAVSDVIIPDEGEEYRYTLTSDVYSESPIPGQDGPITESATGTLESVAGEDTFTSEAEGYVWTIEEALKSLRPRLALRRLSRFRRH